MSEVLRACAAEEGSLMFWRRETEADRFFRDLRSLMQRLDPLLYVLVLRLAAPGGGSSSDPFGGLGSLIAGALKPKPQVVKDENAA